ncbi:hypothetical protein ACFL1Z_04235, partial [Thermodesulfobacteriota bacterium]
SLTLQFDRQGYSVGLVTNGKITGWNSKIVPISRSPQQMSIILELLARLHMEREGDLHDQLSRGYSLPWGVSCLHLSYDRNGTTSATEAYFRARKIPMRFMVSKKQTVQTADTALTGIDTFGLDDIVTKEDRDR